MKHTYWRQEKCILCHFLENLQEIKQLARPRLGWENGNKTEVEGQKKFRRLM